MQSKKVNYTISRAIRMNRSCSLSIMKHSLTSETASIRSEDREDVPNNIKLNINISRDEMTLKLQVRFAIGFLLDNMRNIHHMIATPDFDSVT